MVGEVMTVCCVKCKNTQNRDSGQNQIFKAKDIFVRFWNLAACKNSFSLTKLRITKLKPKTKFGFRNIISKDLQ